MCMSGCGWGRGLCKELFPACYEVCEKVRRSISFYLFLQEVGPFEEPSGFSVFIIIYIGLAISIVAIGIITLTYLASG